VKDFLRQSQVLTTFGPGAMVDLPDRAVLIEGLQAGRFSVPGHHWPGMSRSRTKRCASPPFTSAELVCSASGRGV
jgi:hypothetical protein